MLLLLQRIHMNLMIPMLQELGVHTNGQSVMRGLQIIGTVETDKPMKMMYLLV